MTSRLRTHGTEERLRELALYPATCRSLPRRQWCRGQTLLSEIRPRGHKRKDAAAEAVEDEEFRKRERLEGGKPHQSVRPTFRQGGKEKGAFDTMAKASLSKPFPARLKGGGIKEQCNAQHLMREAERERALPAEEHNHMARHRPNRQ